MPSCCLTPVMATYEEGSTLSPEGTVTWLKSMDTACESQHRRVRSGRADGSSSRSNSESDELRLLNGPLVTFWDSSGSEGMLITHLSWPFQPF